MMNKMDELMDFLFDDERELLHLGVFPSGTATSEEELAEAVLDAVKFAEDSSVPDYPPRAQTAPRRIQETFGELEV